MAGPTNTERLATLEQSVNALTSAVQQLIDDVVRVDERLPSGGGSRANPAPSSASDALLVALIDRLPMPAAEPNPSPMEIIEAAMLIADRMIPEQPEPNPLEGLQDMLGPLLQNVMANRKNGEGVDALTKAALDGTSSP